MDKFAACADTILARINQNTIADDFWVAARAQVFEQLQKQNNAQSDSAIASALANLKNPNTPILITGQQAGVFLGPAYTLHKTIALLALSKWVRDKTGIQPVCIFWMEANDHDWQEISRATHNPAQNAILQIKQSAGQIGRSIGKIKFEEQQKLKLESDFNDLSDSWPEEMREKLSSTVSACSGPAELFREQLKALFPESGLLIFDPSTAEARNFAKPFFEKLASNSKTVIDDFSTRSKELLANDYPTPVKLNDQIPWFTEDENGVRIRAKADNSSVSPLLLSPDVLSRPMLQDWMFGSLCSVLGAAEISYSRQTDLAYKRLGIRPALRLERLHLTLFKESTYRFLHDQNLDHWSPPAAGFPWPKEFLNDLPGMDAISAQLDVIQSASTELQSLENHYKTNVREDISRLIDRCVASTKKLSDAISKSGLSRHKQLLRQIHRESAWLNTPNGLQERRINSLGLLAHLDAIELPAKLANELNPFNSKMQGIIIDGDGKYRLEQIGTE
jgi:uncharacterized protein YllA (UPF0747 family)